MRDAEAPDRRWFAHLRDRLAASDPAFSRLRLASRAMLSVLLTAALLAAATIFVEKLPIAAYGLSVMLCFTGSMAIRDNTALGQLKSRALAVPIVVAAIFVASLLAPVPWVADVTFLAVIFAAVYVRRFGMRWFAIGMMAFLAFFMGNYLKPAPGDIWLIALATAMALAVTHLVGNYILPSDEERDFRRAMVTIDRRINLILRQLRHAAEAGKVSDEDSKQLRRHVARLRETILMAEGFLPQGAEGSLAAEGAASDVAVALFQLQLVVERLVRSRLFGLPPRALVQAVLDHDERAVSRLTSKLDDDGGDEEIPARLLVRLHRGRLRLSEALGPSPSRAFAGAAGNSAPQSPPAAKGGDKRPWVPQALQSPIQITLACAIAMGIGLMVSPVRWYWAVITAFIVFNNTRSRGDTAIRALQRSAGTFGGFLVGTAVATVLQGHVASSAVLIFLLFFLAFYFVQTSYSVMIFFITIALALLYGLMGMFTPEILMLRLEETVIGAVAGTMMAFLVFPKKTMSGVGEGLGAYLSALEKLVRVAAAEASGNANDELLALSRTLDRKYADLGQLVRPLGGPWNAVTRFGEVRERLLLLSGCAHWGRVLAQGVSAGRHELKDGEAARMEELADRIEAQVAAAKRQGAQFFERVRRQDSDIPLRRPLVRSEKDHPIVALEAISALLDTAGWPAPQERGDKDDAAGDALKNAV